MRRTPIDAAKAIAFLSILTGHGLLAGCAVAGATANLVAVTAVTTVKAGGVVIDAAVDAVDDDDDDEKKNDADGKKDRRRR